MIDSLRLECIKIGSDALTKEQLIKEISALAKKSPILADIDQKIIEEKLFEREKIVSTGLTNGIAIPHCTFPELGDFVVGLVVMPDGIDFKALDKSRSNLIFFIIGNEENRNKHIKILSSISKLAKDKELFNKIKDSKDAESVFEALQTSLDISYNIKTNKCQFIIHIQNEDLFFDVLEILSSVSEGSISVIETNNAGYYLNKLPLFSSFWNDTDKIPSKIIVAVMNSRLMNDTIRRINMIKEKDTKGVLVTVNDIIYSEGEIDF
jgi:mannitol/fructose-specific phosphotransferase system IIA component (Ntr-type)